MSRLTFRGAAALILLVFTAGFAAAAEPKAQTKLETVTPPTAVKITHPQQLIATPLSGLCHKPVPDFLVGAVAFKRQVGTGLIVDGRVEFEVMADGPIVVAACYESDGNMAGSWTPQIWKEAKFAKEGWKFVTDLPLFDKAAVHKLYVRQCRAGEKFAIRSRKYSPPIVIIPAAEQLAKASAAVGAPAAAVSAPSVVANPPPTTPVPSPATSPSPPVAPPTAPAAPPVVTSPNPPSSAVPQAPVSAPAAESIASSSSPYLQIRDAKATLPDRTEVLLPRPFTDLATGANGRLLFCLLKDDMKLIVVDLEKSQIVREIGLPSADALVAAGREKFVIVFPSQKLLQRWSIATFEREKTMPIPADGVPTSIVLGSNSTGPVLFWRNGESPLGQPVALWDLEQLRPLQTSGDVMLGVPRYQQQITCSADGRTFVGWANGISGQNYSAMRLSGTTAVSVSSQDDHSYNGHWCMPGPEGDNFFSGEHKMYGYDLKPFSVDWMKGRDQEYFPFPCEDPRFMVAVRRREAPEPKDPKLRRDPLLRDLHHYDAVVCSVADRIPLCTLENVAQAQEKGHMGRFDIGHVRFQPRVRYLPAAQKLVVIPTTNDRIETYRFDLQDQLASSGRKFLYTVSKPPAVVDKGKKLSYQIEVLASSASLTLTYRLESGPEGTTISPTGLVEWTAGAVPSGGVAQFVTSIAGTDGTEAFHSFDVIVRDPSAVVASVATPTRPGVSAPKPTVSRLVSAKQLDPNRIELPEGPFTYVAGHANGSMLLLCGQELSILDRDGITVQRTVKLPKKYVALIERSTHYVAVSDDPDKVIDVIDKKTMKVLRSFNLPFLRFSDLVPHPTLPICYLAFEYTTSVPGGKFLVFDERTAKAYGDEDFVATWMVVDPAGKYLIAGFRDIYQDGNELLVNPGRLHVVPTYGTIDWMLSYKLAPDGKPKLEKVMENIGANGRGLRLSPDGTRLTYLSFTGSPHSRGNLVGFMPRDLDANPVTYRVKDKGTCEELAFHPSLPFAASPGKDKVMFLNPLTGDELRDYLEADAVPTGAKVNRMWFSPDGKNAVFAVALNEIEYLVSAPLKLSPEELRRASAAPAVPVVRTPPPEPPVSVPAKDLEALQPGTRKPLTTKDIGREFMGSVVVIQTDEGSGTGFVVGSSGYVLTCAHVVGDAMTVDVITPPMDGGPERKRSGRVLRKDPERDLALVKVTVAAPLKTVRFNTTSPVEVGEHVTVIGNPAVGRAILTHTMTEGIVSSPERTVAGQKLIQTSAAINPGNSGGPMFDSCGEVIGLVVLKARIEGAGFAVPVPALVAFLTGTPATDVPAAPAVPAAPQTATVAKPVDPTAQRTWTDATGQFKIEAKYVSVSNGSVNLLKPDGSIVAVPIDKLSEADRRLVADLSKGR